MSFQTELPKGWTPATIGEVCSDIQYGWTTSAAKTGKIRLLRTTDITSGKVNWDTVPFCKDAPPDVSKYLLEEGDIVISRAGSVGESILLDNPQKAIFASYLIRFRPLIDKKYVAYFLKSPMYWKSISEKKLGIAVPNVNATKLKEVVMPLPPLPEQKRIVSKLEELFTRLDAGIETLKKAKMQLKQYRESLLNSAFQGRLTEQWRELHEVEHADKLLEQIKDEKAKSASKIEPASIETGLLPRLPDKWIWSKIEDVLLDARYGTSEKCNYEPNTTAVLRIPNIANGRIDLQDLKYTKLTDAELKKLRLEVGDILVTRTNGSRDLVGKSAMFVNSEGQFAFASYLIRLRVALAEKIANYLNHYLQSQLPLRFIQNNARTTAGQYNVNLGILSSIPIPMPSLEEQEKIVEEIERQMSVIDSLGKAIGQTIIQSNLMRQSILKIAFEGNLVSQNPTDEPAPALLQKLQAEKIEHQEGDRIRTKPKARVEDVTQRTLI